MDSLLKVYINLAEEIRNLNSLVSSYTHRSEQRKFLKSKIKKLEKILDTQWKLVQKYEPEYYKE